MESPDATSHEFSDDEISDDDIANDDITDESADTSTDKHEIVDTSTDKDRELHGNNRWSHAEGRSLRA